MIRAMSHSGEKRTSYRCRTGATLAAAIALVLLVGSAAAALAQSDAENPATLPGAVIAPAVAVPEGSSAGAEGAPGLGAPAPALVRHHRAHHSEAAASSNSASEVEPAKARLKLKQDSVAYARPAKSSKHIEAVHAGKFLNVTGLTHYYLQVKLKSGATAYVPISAVELTRPTDKVFRLTANAPVLSAPSRYGNKLAAVHKGHSVHVVGVSLNHMKIKMKNGLEGYIPISALE
jgi:hypothetical protein